MTEIVLVFYFLSYPAAQILKNGILLPKLFWPTVRKNCSSDREKLMKFETEGLLRYHYVLKKRSLDRNSLDRVS